MYLPVHKWFFNLAVNQEFDLKDEDDQIRYYRTKLDYFQVKENGQILEGELIWNDDYNVLIFKSLEILPAKSTLEAKVKVHFEEKVNGVWQVMKDEGKDVYEDSTITFTTGEAPDYIPLQNIVYSWPVINQLHFLKK